MRILQKYKIYTKSRNIVKYPLRLLKFKRTKWLLLKKKLLKTEFKKTSYNNNEYIKIEKGVWENAKHAHKNKVFGKRALFLLLNLDKRALKRINTKSKFFSTNTKSFLGLTYFSDYSLFFNKFYPSVFSSKKAIVERRIFLNGNSLTSPIKLKKGDFLHINDSSYSLSNISKKFTQTESYNTCCEIDYYSQSILMIKSDNNVTNEDYYTSVSNYVNYNLIKRI